MVFFRKGLEMEERELRWEGVKGSRLTGFTLGVKRFPYAIRVGETSWATSRDIKREGELGSPRVEKVEEGYESRKDRGLSKRRR